jgi:hypothetical protein
MDGTVTPEDDATSQPANSGAAPIGRVHRLTRQPDEPEQPAPPRAKRSRRGCLVILFLLLLLLVGVVVGVWYWWRERTRAEVDQIVASFHQHGWELSVPVVPAARGDEPSRQANEEFYAALDELTSADTQTAVRALPYLGQGTPPTAGRTWGQLNFATSVLERMQPVLDRLQVIGRDPEQIFYPIAAAPVDALSDADWQRLDTGSRFLQLAATVRSRQEDRSPAIDTLCAAWAWSEPLVRRAAQPEHVLAWDKRAGEMLETVLERATFDQDRLRQLQLLIDGRDYRDLMSRWLKQQLAVGNQWFVDPQYFAAAPPTGNSPDGSPLPAAKPHAEWVEEAQRWRRYSPFFYEDHALFLDHMAGMINAVHQGFITAPAAAQAIEQEWRRRVDAAVPNWKFGISRRLIPSVSSKLDNAVNLEARRQLYIAAIAARRYEITHQAFPTSLSQLAPEFVDQLPEDVWTGQPLQLRIEEGTLVIYSVGPNARDDQLFAGGGDDVAVRLINAAELREPMKALPVVQ